MIDKEKAYQKSKRKSYHKYNDDFKFKHKKYKRKSKYGRY